jgi:hypothetical protein
MRKLSRAGLLLPALFFALSQAAPAQTRDVSRVVSAQAPVDVRAALASFPDSQVVLFVNTHRLVNEALPRVMQPADYQKLLDAAQRGGLDPRALEYTAVGVRFTGPSGSVPEFVAVARGGFNADALLAIGRLALASQNISARQESYGSKTIEIFDAGTFAKMAGQNPALPGMPSTEVGVAALDAGTLVAGSPAYVRAAIDAAQGRGGLKSSTIDLATRDPQTVVSLTADIPPSLSDTVHKFGLAGNQELDEMLSWMKQLSLSGGMNATDFTLGMTLLTDAPEHASAFNGLARMGLVALQSELDQQAAKATGKDADNARALLGVLKTVVNKTEGSTLVITASIPQTTVAQLVKQQTAKPATATTRRHTRRRARRRTTRRQ